MEMIKISKELAEEILEHLKDAQADFYFIETQEVIDKLQEQVKNCSIPNVVEQSKQLPQIHGLIKCECGKGYDVDIENNCPKCDN